MEEIQKIQRKIRAKIRKDAKKEKISTKEYREKYSITSKWIRDKAAEKIGETTGNTSANKHKNYFKPFDGVSNKPQYSSLYFGKPILRIVYNKMHNFDFLVYLAQNGHYLTKSKIFRSENGEAIELSSLGGTNG
jgi:hypothetical protein